VAILVWKYSGGSSARVLGCTAIGARRGGSRNICGHRVSAGEVPGAVKGQSFGRISREGAPAPCSLYTRHWRKMLALTLTLTVVDLRIAGHDRSVPGA